MKKVFFLFLFFAIFFLFFTGNILASENILTSVRVNPASFKSLNIGDDAIIGMGSVVFRDVPSGVIVLGNPARETRGNAEHKIFVAKE